MKIARHYVDEWERYPDLFTLEPEPSADDANLYAARRVARAFAYRFEMATPRITKNNRRTTCQCACPGREYFFEITLCANFTIGQLLHELAHVYVFSTRGDHFHDDYFVRAMNLVCEWFRLNPEVQKECFP